MPMMDFFELAGGIQGDLLGCIPGGSSAPVLDAEECAKATMDYESLQGLGSMLGSGAVCPFNTDRDPVTMLATLTRFYAHESCINAPRAARAPVMLIVSCSRSSKTVVAKTILNSFVI